MEYSLWVDDIKHPIGEGDFEDDDGKVVLWAKDVEQAAFYVKRHGMPTDMYLDFDLGDSNVLEFLRWLFSNEYIPSCAFHVISYNPEGCKQIISFIESWRKSVAM